MGKRGFDRALASLALASLLVGCPAWMSEEPASPPTMQLALPAQVPHVAGAVYFPVAASGGDSSAAGRNAQALMTEVATAATVSLIDSATNETVSSTVTDTNYRFDLAFRSGFIPKAGAIYYLEAVKGLSAGGSPNRAGAPVARVRTLIAFKAGAWDSVTGLGLVISRSTTTLAVLASLHAAAGLPVDTAALIGSLAVDTSDSTLSPATPDTFTPGASQIGNDEFHAAHELVTSALVADQDPLFAVALEQGSSPRRFSLTAPSFSMWTVSPASGAAGDTVTIAGYGFDPDPADQIVRFNGFQGTVQSVSADRKTLTVKVPRRTGLTGPVSVQVGGLIKTGPSWSQNAWADPLDDDSTVRGPVNLSVSGGVLQMTGSGGQVDSTGANFAAGAFNGLARVNGTDPVDGGDGAVDLGITALRVAQIYPDGHHQTAAAQGVYNWRPDLFTFELVPTSVFNALTSLDSAFTATVINKSGTVAPATAAVGDPVERTLRDYDVIYFGIADSYAGMDLTTNGRDLTRSFGSLGRGVLFTHDTIGMAKFQSLSDLHGLGTAGKNPWIWASTVYQAPGVNKSSPVLTRPFDLSGVSTFNIQGSHSLSQSTDLGATVWFAYSTTEAGITPYWTTYTTGTSNSAFFSFGHTEAVPAEFEAKAMINSMYYTYDRGTTVSGAFTSRPLDSGTAGFNWGGMALSWISRLPNANCVASFQVAATDDASATSLTYVGPGGTPATAFTSTGTALPSLSGRYLRYRATLSTNSILTVPLLSRVDLGGSVGLARSIAIQPNSLSRWDQVVYSVTTPGASAVRIQILDKAGNPLPDNVLAGNSTGFGASPVVLTGVPVATYPILRLKATLMADQGNKPSLNDWRVDFTP